MEERPRYLVKTSTIHLQRRIVFSLEGSSERLQIRSIGSHFDSRGLICRDNVSSTSWESAKYAPLEDVSPEPYAGKQKCKDRCLEEGMDTDEHAGILLIVVGGRVPLTSEWIDRILELVGVDAIPMVAKSDLNPCEQQKEWHRVHTTSFLQILKPWAECERRWVVWMCFAIACLGWIEIDSHQWNGWWLVWMMSIVA